MNLLTRCDWQNLFKLSEHKIDGFYKLTTPFLYLDWDLVNIYVKKCDDYLLLIDMGDYSAWLNSHLITEEPTEKQQLYINEILSCNNIFWQNGILTKEVHDLDKMTSAIFYFGQAISHLSVAIRIT